MVNRIRSLSMAIACSLLLMRCNNQPRNNTVARDSTAVDDRFAIKGAGIRAIYYLRIFFDRWGEVILKQ
ncbi:MAG: hypothetical protein ACJ75B_06710 [Flavisolibacter sp.]